MREWKGGALRGIWEGTSESVVSVERWRDAGGIGRGMGSWGGRVMMRARIEHPFQGSWGAFRVTSNPSLLLWQIASKHENGLVEVGTGSILMTINNNYMKY